MYKVIMTSLIFVLLVLSFLVSEPYSFMIIVLLSVLMFITEAIPPVITGFGIVILLFLLSPSEEQALAVYGFHSPIIFFLISVTGIGIAISKSGLGGWFLFSFEKTVLNYPRMPVPVLLMLAFLPLSLLLPSSITRNAMLLPLLKNFIHNERLWEGRRIYLMLGLINPMASSAFLTGGMSAIVTASLIGGISWGEWFILMAFPYYLMMLSGLLYILFRFPLKNLKKVSLKPTIKPSMKKVLAKDDWVLLSVLILVVVLWITDKWHMLNPAVPALIGLVMIFLFTDSLNLDDLKASSIWENTIIIGSLLSLIEALNRYGVLDLASYFITENIGNGVPENVLIICCIILTVIFNLFIPNITVCVTFLVPLYIGLAHNLQMNPVVFGLLAALTVDCIKFYPAQSTPLLMVYDRSVFSPKDVFDMGLFLFITLLIGVFLLILPYWKLVAA
ncbi:anion permease [Bacillus sp. ISL-47]|uniref:SLC13 family permease n=1 Tax=Bacillus sp. ISL-47 TaxID=2819130 RepID=UPI001BEC5ED1|nr:SLC13 family permease [Bacillus sp. ISL-47]MBT2690333.1 anion permease [Bacillus sp. ISL-47]MBT2709219.1 anion permease [Pseudomonas sp. ISL-84]